MKKRIVVYIHTKDDSWECFLTKSDTREYIDSDILIEIMKRNSKGSCLGPFPKIVVLPEGVFRETGSGYNFMSGCRDVCYDELTDEEYSVWNRRDLLWTFKKKVHKFVDSLMWKCFFSYVQKIRLKLKSGTDLGPLPEPCAYPAESEIESESEQD